MSTLFAVLFLVVGVWVTVSILRRHRRGIVAERGTSIGADLGALGDQLRVQIRSVTTMGPDLVRLVLTPETGPADDPAEATASDLDLVLVVAVREEDFGFGLLHDWQRSQCSLAIVMPPNTHIVRLRAIDDLQPLTLHRVD